MNRLKLAASLLAAAAPLFAQGTTNAMFLKPPNRHMARLPRRLFGSAPQQSSLRSTRATSKISACSGRSRPARTARSKLRRCWWMAFSTSPCQTTSGPWTRAPAISSGTTLTPRIKGFHIGSRGVSMYGEWLYFMTPDAHLICLNAKDGKVRWNVVVADSAKGYWSNHVSDDHSQSRDCRRVG